MKKEDLLKELESMKTRFEPQPRSFPNIVILIFGICFIIMSAFTLEFMQFLVGITLIMLFGRNPE